MSATRSAPTAISKTPAPDRTSANSTPTIFTWPRICGYALVLGVGAAALQLLTVPIEQIDADLFYIFLDVAVQYSIIGLCNAAIAKRGSGSLPGWAMGVAVVLIAIVVAALHAWFGVLNIVGTDPVYATRGLTSFLYDAWHGAFYGGLFMLALCTGIRTEQTQRLLWRAEVERNRTEALLDEAHLEALQGHVDPRLLLRVMAEVQRRYAHDPLSADALLDQLVAFLREAMPGVRSGRSTLASELDVARAYIALGAELEPDGTRWTVQTAVPTGDLPFPPLLLLPVIDRFAEAIAATGRNARCRLAITARPGADHEVMLTLSSSLPVDGQWLSSSLMHRLRVGLHSIFGADASLLVGRDIGDRVDDGVGDVGDLPALRISLQRVDSHTHSSPIPVQRSSRGSNSSTHARETFT